MNIFSGQHNPYWVEDSNLQPEPLEYYKKEYGHGVWITKPWVLREANQLIGLADMYSSLMEDLNRLENYRDQDDKSIAKLMRRENILKCVRHWITDYRLIYPETKGGSIADMALNLFLKNSFNSSALNGDDHFDDEWIALRDIKYPKGLIERLENLE